MSLSRKTPPRAVSVSNSSFRRADYRDFYAQHLKSLRWRGTQGSALCPFHDDHRQSLSANAESGLWFCHACNVGGTVFDFAGRLHVEPPTPISSEANLTIYDYRDENGLILFQVVRFPNKKFRQRRPDPKGKWIWKLEDARRVPYRLPELLSSKGNVFIVEGEKDVETIRAAGFAATTNPGGAGKWRDEYSPHLRGRVCILIPDNDDSGREHMEDVRRKLAFEASQVLILELPGLPEHGDVTDWLNSGHNTTELLELVRRADEASRAALGGSVTAEPSRSAGSRDWPSRLDEKAFYGPAGDFVRMVEPYTEADCAALLVQFLIGFGNLCGNALYRSAGGTAHHLNEYAVIVGDTSRARKGTSWAEVERFLEKIDRDWVRKCVTSGLSTGEGLIWNVRDPQEEEASGSETNRRGAGGILDKRLTVQAGEFASVLKVAGREGATLSPVLREAWDGKTLRTLAKNSPATATGAHISIVAHITQEELVRSLDSTEVANGFANRFLWVCARRSKILPWGGNTLDARLDGLADQIRRAAYEARKPGEFTFEEPAKPRWEAVYQVLTGGKPGLLGAILARSEAHVLRLACIYSALDAIRLIRFEHLEAAMAVWDYCEKKCDVYFRRSARQSRCGRDP